MHRARAVLLCCALSCALLLCAAPLSLGAPAGGPSEGTGARADAAAKTVTVGQYPIANRYKATVYGTPPEYRHRLDGAVLAMAPDTRSIKIEGRRVPELFWYCDAIEYSVLLQKREAPLIFIIAGTGARFNSSKVQFLQRLFYSAGYHAVGVSSPTHFNSIVSLSKHGLAGYVPFDVDDLRTLLGWIRQDVEKEAKVSGYSITGYSLGAMHAAFLAERDAREKYFNFQKVLLINPPADLYNSALVFDSWLKEADAETGGAERAVTKFIENFSEFYHTNHLTKVDSEILYRFFRGLEVSDTELKQVIGVGFRVTAASMIFTSDVCLNAGYVVPPGTRLEANEPLLPYFVAASRVSFENYVDEFLLPYVQSREPGMTRARLVAGCSLRSIEGFLRGAGNVLLIGNEDDPILSAGEPEFLKDVFGGRGFMFSRGGHCGNLVYAGFAAKILELMAPEGAK